MVRLGKPSGCRAHPTIVATEYLLPLRIFQAKLVDLNRTHCFPAPDFLR